MNALHPVILRIGIAALFLLNMSAALAQPPRNKILDRIHIGLAPGCVLIDVSLSYPFRYRSHFPYAFGDELRVKIEPIAVSHVDRSAFHHREGFTPKLPKGALQLGVELLEVVYEGDIPDGPYITLFFRHPVSFQVAQGSDFRSVLVASSGPEALSSCQPALPRIE